MGPFGDCAGSCGVTAFLFGPRSDYRLHCLDARGNIRATEWLDAKTDDEAIVFARTRRLDVQSEVWSGNRLVATIPAVRSAVHDRAG